MPSKKPSVKRRRSFTKEFKLQVLHEIAAGTTLAEAARVHDVHPETIRAWRKMERKYGERSFAGNGRAYTDEARIAQLERLLGQLTVENAVLKKALSSLKELDRRSGVRR
jgi:transposase